jgi:hypothetical protein
MAMDTPLSIDTRQPQWLAWLPIIAGLMVLYVPSFRRPVSNGIWATDEQKHGPIVCRRRLLAGLAKVAGMWQASEGQAPSTLGLADLVVGLLLYIIGRSQDILLFEVGSHHLAARRHPAAHARHGGAEGAVVRAVLHALHDPLTRALRRCA